MPTTLAFQETHNYAADSAKGISVPVWLRSRERTVHLLAKLDTGAEHCIFQREYAEELRLNLEAGDRQVFSTATGTFVAYGHPISMRCFVWEIDSFVFFAEQPNFIRNVLGRNGWLQKFRLAIIDYDSLLHISHYDAH